MDGVLANLYDYMSERMFQKKFVDLNEDQIFVFKKIFREKMYFDYCFPEGAEAVFENLEPFPFNKALIETVTKFGNEYSILSRPCKLNIQGTKRAKIKWVERHLAFCPPKDVILVQDKSSNGRAEGNVLIDDWDDFLVRWEQKGGYPIKYKAVDFNEPEAIQDYIQGKLIKISSML